MSELDAASVRVYLGAFEPEDDTLCSVPLCRTTADRIHAWLIDGELCTLWLCRRCLGRAISALDARPVRARLVTFDEARDRMATELAKVNVGKTGRRFTTRSVTAYPRGALGRRCPICYAEPGEPCRTAWGTVTGAALGEPHNERRDAYQKSTGSL